MVFIGTNFGEIENIKSRDLCHPALDNKENLLWLDNVYQNLLDKNMLQSF